MLKFEQLAAAVSVSSIFEGRLQHTTSFSEATDAADRAKLLQAEALTGVTGPEDKHE